VANKPGVQVEGLKGLVRALKRAGADDLLAALKSANAEAAKTVEETARPDVPSRSGKLVGSLRSSATPRAGVVRIGKASVPYAGPIHFGWPARNIAPRPFLYEALDQRADEILGLYHDRIERLCDAVARETD
jgi:hypothetical protein